MKLWAGRFEVNTDPEVERFTASVDFDRRLFQEDIQGSIAHARMLARQGIITPKEAESIARALRAIEKEIASGEFRWKREHEDVHMNIEAALIERLGEVGAKLHAGRSRNDQVALDMRLYIKRVTKDVISAMVEVQAAILTLAEAHPEAVMPGYTHLQPAQPVLFSHHLLAYFEMLERDKTRFADAIRRADVCPLGAGALAGSTLPLDPNFTSQELGFADTFHNSIDAVSDRDFVLEFLAASAILMMHLSRLGEEIVLWSTAEMGFVELAESYTTGSSLMPQKKNPDVAELVRAKTGRVYGHLVALLTVLKGLPLSYNRDMQEDKEALFDTVDTVLACLQVSAGMIRTLKVNATRMSQAADNDYLLATDLAEYLVRKGTPFREAHALVGALVKQSHENQRHLRDLTIEEMREFSGLFDEGACGILSVDTSLSARRSHGGTAPDRVREEIREPRKRIKVRRV